jgi:hypothetical protein
MSWFGLGSIFTKPGGATAIRAENLTTKKPKATGNSANSGNSGHVALNVAGENGVKAATVGQLPAAQLQATPHPSVTSTQGGGRRKTKGKGKKGKGRKTGKSKGKKRSTRK